MPSTQSHMEMPMNKCCRAMFIKSLIKKSINRLLPSFSPDFTSNSQIRPVFYAEKWFFLKKLGNLFKEWFKHSKEFITFFEEIFLAKAK